MLGNKVDLETPIVISSVANSIANNRLFDLVVAMNHYDASLDA